MDFYKKKQKKLNPERKDSIEEGDAWAFTDIKRNSYLFVSYAVGKRTQKTCDEMLNTLYDRIKHPTQDNKLEIFSDGNFEYATGLGKLYDQSCIEYGQLIKYKEGGKLVGKEKRVIFGQPDIDDIETTDVENYNSILRSRLSRLVRKSKCFSKKRNKLCDAIELMQFHWNFMDTLPKRGTPAMEEKLADHQWSWDEFLLGHYAV